MDRVLGAAYHAPYGTPLGPDDVRVEELAHGEPGRSDGRAVVRRLRLRARGTDERDHEHELRVDERGLGHPLVDGTPLPGGVVGPALGEQIAPDDPDLEVLWVDQVLRGDAEARLSMCEAARAAPAPPWEGDGVGAALERAERNVVSYQDEWASTEDVRKDESLSTWLRRHTPYMTAPWELFRLDLDSEECLGHRVEKYVFLREYACRDAQDSNGPRIRYLLHAFDPRNRAPETFQLVDGTPFTAFIGVRTDGPAVVAYDADGVLPRDLLEPHLVPLRDLGSVPLDERTEAESWVAVGIAGTPMLLLIPPGPSVLRLHTDDDGALTVLELSDLEVTRTSRLREKRFRRRWGRFLDENVELAQEEIDRAVRELHERLERRHETLAADLPAGPRVEGQQR
ncbi:hypothetical protein [Kocuria tytonis]|uniref:Uncharacterized protein n=1 Tax=Kocuria tytonis TaxID=2054280 RepID=A0A495ABB0_9MICC|nr:hypothetical protein [Kocuria tytonis]RKQ37103.1 hypothetical protein C1C97_005875 [Kocuria tytonis]